MPKVNVKEELKDFDNQEGLSVAEIVAKEVAKAEARIKGQMAKGSTNAVQIGLTVLDLEVKEGAMIKDRLTGELQIDNNTNEPKRYPNKFHAKFSFNGGSLEQEIKPMHYDSLQVGKKYFATGYMGEVKIFKDMVMMPIFNDFEPLEV